MNNYFKYDSVNFLSDSKLFRTFFPIREMGYYTHTQIKVYTYHIYMSNEEQILSFVLPFQFDKSIVLMDNLSIVEYSS